MRRRNRERGLGGLGTEDWIGFDTIGKIFGGDDKPDAPIVPSRKQVRRDKQWARGAAARGGLLNAFAGRNAAANANVMLTTGALLLAGGVLWFLSRRKKR